MAILDKLSQTKQILGETSSTNHKLGTRKQVPDVSRKRLYCRPASHSYVLNRLYLGHHDPRITAYRKKEIP